MGFKRGDVEDTALYAKKFVRYESISSMALGLKDELSVLYTFDVLDVLSGFVNSSFLHDWNAITENAIINKTYFFMINRF